MNDCCNHNNHINSQYQTHFNGMLHLCYTPISTIYQSYISCINIMLIIYIDQSCTFPTSNSYPAMVSNGSSNTVNKMQIDNTADMNESYSNNNDNPSNIYPNVIQSRSQPSSEVYQYTTQSRPNTPHNNNCYTSQSMTSSVNRYNNPSTQSITSPNIMQTTVNGYNNPSSQSMTSSVNRYNNPSIQSITSPNTMRITVNTGNISIPANEISIPASSYNNPSTQSMIPPSNTHNNKSTQPMIPPSNTHNNPSTPPMIPPNTMTTSNTHNNKSTQPVIPPNTMPTSNTHNQSIPTISNEMKDNRSTSSKIIPNSTEIRNTNTTTNTHTKNHDSDQPEEKAFRAIPMDPRYTITGIKRNTHHYKNENIFPVAKDLYRLPNNCGGAITKIARYQIMFPEYGSYMWSQWRCEYNDCDSRVIKHGSPFKHMAAHKHLHRDQHPYYCSKCDSVFPFLRDIKVHDCDNLRTKRIYECIYCGCRFGDRHSCKWMGKRLFYGMDNESCLE